MKTQLRVFTIDANTMPMGFNPISSTDEEFMHEANKQGYMLMTLEDFESKYNQSLLDYDNDIIRFIEVELHELTQLDNDLYERAE